MNSDVLVISAGLPLKNSKDAGSGQVYGVISDLIELGYSVHLVSSVYKNAVYNIKDLPVGMSSQKIITLKKSHFTRLKVFKILFSLVKPLWIYWKPRDGLMKSAINDLLCEKDIGVINIQWTSMARFVPFIKKFYPGKKIVTYMHDIDSQGFVRKVPDIALVKRIATPILNRIDREVVRTSDIVLTPSKKDAVLLERIVPNISHKSIIPIKLNLQLFWEAPPVTSVSTIGFFGAMFRPENYTAVEWFLDNVWENIKKEGFVFEIAGEGLPLHLKDRISAIEGVTYLGFVENLETFVTQCDLFVAPLKSGAGIKFKVLQAISAGRPVLGSEIAFEGIDNKNVLKRCETPKDYIDLLLTLKNDVNLLSGLSKKSVYLATEFTSQGKTTAEVIKSM